MWIDYSGVQLSNSTLTPLLRKAGMCVRIELELSGFFLTLTRLILTNLVSATKGDRSDTLLLLTSSHVRLVKPDRAEISDTEFFLRYSDASLVKLESIAISDTLLLLIPILKNQICFAASLKNGKEVILEMAASLVSFSVAVIPACRVSKLE